MDLDVEGGTKNLGKWQVDFVAGFFLMSGKFRLVYLYKILIESIDKYKYTQIEIVYINI